MKVYVLTVALLATFLIGSSRVYLGVHYPIEDSGAVKKPSRG